MAKLSVQQIRERARAIVAENPGGIRYRALVDRIQTESPDTSAKAIESVIWNLEKTSSDVSKPSRGLYTPRNGDRNDSPVINKEEEIALSGVKVREVDFYEPFAQWLKKDLNEVTEVAALGGAGIGAKWGTPDVVGIYKPLAGNLIKFPLEIVSAEIKIVPQTPVVAFGQAVAYRLFSSKTYVAMPTTLTEEDLSRLEALCMLFGVGLVLFDIDKNNPRFAIRVRAQRFSPDMFYVNDFAERLKQHNTQMFENLFR